MTNEQVLKKAIEKAVKNGFKYAPYTTTDGIHPVFIEIPEISIYRHLIFSHDFAKAFWGEKEHYFGKEGVSECKCGYQPYESALAGDMCWEVYLQQMVLEEEPLKYLEKFI